MGLPTVVGRIADQAAGQRTGQSADHRAFTRVSGLMPDDCAEACAYAGTNQRTVLSPGGATGGERGCNYEGKRHED